MVGRPLARDNKSLGDSVSIVGSPLLVVGNKPVLSSDEDSKADRSLVSEWDGDVSDADGLSALKTPRIARRGGLISAEPLSSFVPVTGRQTTRRERVTYSMPFVPIRQLTKRDLGEFDNQLLLNDIEAVANSAP
jgi:hypothetical protein